MHASHFRPRAGSSSSRSGEMSSERLRAMKASAMRALVGRSPNPSSSASPSPPRMTCLCAPTSHPGSFRCKMHRNQALSKPTARAAPPSIRTPPPPPTKHRTCSSCLVRGRSRLSKVAFATGDEESQLEAPEMIMMHPNPLPVVRIAAVHRDRITSAAIGARFCALRRLQGSGKDDFLRVIRPTSPRILLST